MSNSIYTPGVFQNVSTLAQNLRSRESIQTLRSELLKAQTQLGSGKKTETHGGLRADATIAQHLRHVMTRVDSYTTTIGVAQARLGTIQSSLDTLQTTTEKLGMQGLLGRAPGFAEDLRMARSLGRSGLETMIHKLNAAHGGRYLFGGAEIDRPPVASGSAMIEGAGGRQGLRDVAELRRQADFGATGTGRIGTLSDGANLATVRHTGGAFGMKLVESSPPATAATVTAILPTKQVDLTYDLTATAAGDRLGLTLEMPEGTQATLTFVATNDATLNGQATGAENTYYVSLAGAPRADNFAAAAETAVRDLATRELTGYSAIAAGNDFFDHQAPRVPDNADPTLATGHVFDATGTVSWYEGTQTVPTVGGPANDPTALAPAPSAGDTWLVGTGAVGTEWENQNGRLATFNGVSWEFTSPELGSRVIDEAGYMQQHDGTNWVNLGLAPAQQSVRDGLQAKVDDGYTVSYGARADEQSVRDSLKGAALLSAAAYDPDAPNPFKQVSYRAGLLLNEAHRDVIETRADVGVIQERMEALEERHADHKVVVNTQLNSVEEADLFEVSARLQDLMTRLQSSYQITARLSSLSLTSYL